MSTGEKRPSETRRLLTTVAFSQPSTGFVRVAGAGMESEQDVDISCLGGFAEKLVSSKQMRTAHVKQEPLLFSPEKRNPARTDDVPSPIACKRTG